MMFTSHRVSAAVLAAALTASGLTAVALAGPAAADGPGSGAPWVASVGDSYMSGEAGRWAGSSNTSSSYADALGSSAYFDNAAGTGEQIVRCHRRARSRPRGWRRGAHGWTRAAGARRQRGVAGVNDRRRAASERDAARTTFACATIVSSSGRE